jgi:DnaJ family protein C protein 16
MSFFITAGAFMGFDDSEMDGSDSEPDVEGQRVQPKVPILNEPDNLPIFEDQLLDGLQNWLDRLFEGSTYRYHINYWPEFPISPANFNARSH